MKNKIKRHALRVLLNVAMVYLIALLFLGIYLMVSMSVYMIEMTLKEGLLRVIVTSPIIAIPVTAAVYIAEKAYPYIIKRYRDYKYRINRRHSNR